MMIQSFKKYICESVQGGLSPASQQGMAIANYSVSTTTGERTFKILFSYNPNNQGLHINWLGGQGETNAQFPEIIQKFATDVCQKFGPVNPQNISFSPSDAKIKGNQQGDRVRERLFKRYISQVSNNMPDACKFSPPNTQISKYQNHPLRNAFKGSDQEFAQMFGI